MLYPAQSCDHQMRFVQMHYHFVWISIRFGWWDKGGPASMWLTKWVKMMGFNSHSCSFAVSLLVWSLQLSSEWDFCWAFCLFVNRMCSDTDASVIFSFSFFLIKRVLFNQWHFGGFLQTSKVWKTTTCFSSHKTMASWEEVIHFLTLKNLV